MKKQFSTDIEDEKYFIEYNDMINYYIYSSYIEYDKIELGEFECIQPYEMVDAFLLADSKWSFEEILKNILVLDHTYLCEGKNGYYQEFDYYFNQLVEDKEYELDKNNRVKLECLSDDDLYSTLNCTDIVYYAITNDYIEFDWIVADPNWGYNELFLNISVMDHTFVYQDKNAIYIEYDYFMDQFFSNFTLEFDEIDLGEFECLQPYEIADVFFLANSNWTFEEVMKNYTTLESIQLCVNKNGDFYIESDINNDIDKYFDKFVSLAIEIFEKQGSNYPTVALHFHNLIIHKSRSIFEIKYQVYDNLKQDKSGRNLLLFEDTNPNSIIEFIEWYINIGECIYCSS